MNIYDLINKDIHCICGSTHRCDIEILKIGSGVLHQLPQLLADRRHILLVADSNTYPLCGESVRLLLDGKIESICIFKTDGLLVPNEASVEMLESHITEYTDVVLGIGSGVINDLCKYVSFAHNIPSGIIATAPSMDGYASSGAAMIFEGMKVTVTTHAPSVIIGDVDILKDAPINMIRAGYADIIGKYSALCDWKLSELVNGEYLCPYIYDIVKENTDEIRSLATAIAARMPNAIEKLMESLVLIGACLTLLSTTRPGSGSEHHLSHFFEITGLIEDKPYFLHGIDVGYSTVVTAGLREQIRKVKNPVFKTFTDAERFSYYKAIYRDHWTEVRDIQEKAGWYEKELNDIYTANWAEICKILAECPSAEEIGDMLTEVGFDLSDFEKLYGAEKIQSGIWFGKDLKDRYSVLWLYFKLFFESKKGVEAQNGI